ncbi:MAG: TonB-dependent siderophore receptor [Acidobacteriaceae bacterium]|nr:TonB-dependent siderophore receptor [Acidobacteriaceae bacterium]
MMVIIFIWIWVFLSVAALADDQGTLPINLPAVTVTGTPFGSASLPKLTEPLINTPQMIIEVPAQQAIDQGAFSVDEALRYVPSVNIHANEDTSQRNQFYVRGFSAESDRYLDGMLEIGNWYLDTFNMERLEVLEGPAGVLFGRGSTGGVVNYVSKAPSLSPVIEIGTSFGTDGTKRATVDFDQVVGNATALRINVVGYDGGVADRDRVNFGRFGIAPSVGFGLGTDTRITLSFLHQSEYDLPDYGVPWIDIGSPGTISHPALVPRSNFYGFNCCDFARNDVEIGTLNLAHDFNDGVSVRDQFRYGSYTREFRVTEPGISGVIAPGTPFANITVTRTMQGLRSSETFLDNQTEALLKFGTWEVQHGAVIGLEVGRQTSAPSFFAYSNVPSTNLFDPDPGEPFTATIALGRAVSVQALTQGAYAIDTVHLGNDWLFTGAGRLDRFDASVNQIRPDFAARHTDVVPTWRTALTYKPAPNGSVYFTHGTSFDPSAEGLAFSAATAILAAERSETFEFGSKWQLGKLMVSGAVFRTTLRNVRERSPIDPTLLILAGTAQVDGLELVFAGDPLDHWHVFGGYTYLQTGIIASPQGDLGYRLQNAPKHAAKLWTTYDLTEDFTVGGGIQYVGNRTVQSGPDPAGFLQIVPGYWTAELMARFRLTDSVTLQANIKNLNNAYGYDGIDNNHVVPLAGRSVLFTVTTEF